MHLCILSVVSLCMDADAARTARSSVRPSVRPFVRNPFPTLVMAGIVNSIASELDAVGAPRKRPVRRMRLKARTGRERESCGARSVGASVK